MIPLSRGFHGPRIRQPFTTSNVFSLYHGENQEIPLIEPRAVEEFPTTYEEVKGHTGYSCHKPTEMLMNRNHIRHADSRVPMDSRLLRYFLHSCVRVRLKHTL